MAPAKSPPGVLIALEGIDGTGKTTVARGLAAALEAAGHEAIVTREPGGTYIGEAIREILLGSASSEICPESEALLFAAARAQHVGEVIRPALQRGAIVISDRFTDSSLAYQWGGRGLPLELVQAAQALATSGLTPNLKLLFDMPVELAQQRRLAEGDQANRLDRETLEFHRRVRAAYHELVVRDRARWRVIDASRPAKDVMAETVQMINESGLLSFEINTSDVETGMGSPQ